MCKDFFLFLFVFCFSPLFSDLTNFFHSQEDPSLFHHVNVITGHLNLNFIDHEVKGEVSIPIRRGYSSLGGFEKNSTNFDLNLKELRGGYLIQGGWNFFSYTNLLVYQSDSGVLKAYLSESQGGMQIFDCYDEEKDEGTVLKVKNRCGRYYGALSGRNLIENHRLHLSTKKGVATLYLADGGKRTYFRTIYPSKNKEFTFKNVYYRLVEEILPSGHIIDYFYDRFYRLNRIETKSPNRKQIFSWVDFNIVQSKSPTLIKVETSDGEILNYKGLNDDQRDYMSSFASSAKPSEKIQYYKSREDKGAVLKAIYRNKLLLFLVEYYQEEDGNSFAWDKVKNIYIPNEKTGDPQLLASFEYQPDLTVVKDFKGLKKEYVYRDGGLVSITNFDSEGQQHSKIVFIWKEGRLIGKVFLNCINEAIISKTFVYDTFGNVLKETLYGDLTGNCQAPFTYREDGSLNGADAFSKMYEYDPKTHLLISEKEDLGLKTYYRYLNGTDLVAAKLIIKKDKILKREFYEYDENHLLIQEIVDDGHNLNPEDFHRATFRKIKRFHRSTQDGRILETSEYAVDFESDELKLLKKTALEFNPKRFISSQMVFNSDQEKVYSESYVYNSQGKVVKKIDFDGKESCYQYDASGQLTYQKEVGDLQKIYAYDFQGKKIYEKLGFKTSHIHYDSCGNPTEVVNELGQITRQEFDDFGNCTKMIFSKTFDENGNIYQPFTKMGYDAQGNLIDVEDAQGYHTLTTYTGFRKPKTVIQKDGTINSYYYLINGLLFKTVLPDGSYQINEYDEFHRLVAEKTYSKKGDLIAEERFCFNTFFLTEHIAKNGLKTTFKNDSFGRKVLEKKGDCQVEYRLDSFNRVLEEVHSTHRFVFEYDHRGLKNKAYQIFGDGNIENETFYEYDEEKRLKTVLLRTTKGLSREDFQYDEFNRLVSHKDPLNQVSKVEYENYQDCYLGSLLKKTTIDPKNQIKIEIFDPSSRLIKKSLYDCDEQLVGETEFFYDRVGNQSKIICHIFDQGTFLRTQIFQFQFDPMGRKILESFDGKVLKKFEYNVRGQIKKLIYPSGKEVHYTYDALNRLIELFSSDGSVHYRYFFEKSHFPVLIEDVVNKEEIYRTYNNFDQLTQEVSMGLISKFDYDDIGRLQKHRFFDDSTIEYEYAYHHLKQMTRSNAIGKKITHLFSTYNINGDLETEKYAGKIGYNFYHFDLMRRKIGSFSSKFFQTVAFDEIGQPQSYENSFKTTVDYRYDSLGQVAQEGSKCYRFDSFGDPAKSERNAKGELTEIEGFILEYDLDGNLIKKINEDHIETFTYDALNRLEKIMINGRLILLTYDGLSRIAKIKEGDQISSFLYFGEEEIGKVVDNAIVDLKISVYDSKGTHPLYIEKNGEFFVPFYDFQNRAQALFDLDGQLIEIYQMDLFGNSDYKNQVILPWLFQGKRKISSLYMFPKRIYDPSLKRWLSRDPSGFSDGYNLYVFNLNNPVVKFDFLGLNSENFNKVELNIPIPTKFILDIGDSKGVISTKGLIGNAQVDWMIACGHFHQIKFTSDEIESGQINLANHFAELLPKDGRIIGIITAQNGIMTDQKDFIKFSESISHAIEEGTLMIGLHNPTEGFFPDVMRLMNESYSSETIAVTKTRQFMEAISHTIHQINPDLLWTHITHSEGGIISKRAIETMHEESKERIKNQLKIYSIASASPIPNHMVYEAENVYSELDFLTGGVGRIYSRKSGYNITFLECVSNVKERNLFLFDHAFLGTTYQRALALKIAQERENNNLFQASSF